MAILYGKLSLVTRPGGRAAVWAAADCCR